MSSASVPVAGADRQDIGLDGPLVSGSRPGLILCALTRLSGLSALQALLEHPRPVGTKAPCVHRGGTSGGTCRSAHGLTLHVPLHWQSAGDADR
ncbi:hypothetical protein OAO87_03780 [bacterium]|nr:hypothetical protein [bacterium]